MENKENINTLMREVSGTLLDSKNLLEIIHSLIESDCNVSEGAILTLNTIIINNIVSTFNNVEDYRKNNRNRLTIIFDTTLFF